MKLYHAPRARSLRVLWGAEELGLGDQIELIPASIREPSADFLKHNPSRTVPVLIDGEQTLTESVAILMYLGAKAGASDLVIQPGQAGYGDYVQFLVLGEAGIAAPLNAVVGAKFFAPPGVEAWNFTLDMIMEGAERRLRLVEERLRRSDYMAGDHFTLADVSVGWSISFFRNFLGHGDKLSPAAHDYIDRIEARDAYKRAAAR